MEVGGGEGGGGEGPDTIGVLEGFAGGVVVGLSKERGEGGGERKEEGGGVMFRFVYVGSVACM